MSLVNLLLNLWSLNMAYMLIVLLKNVSSFCICKSYSHLFSKITCKFDIVLTITVNILTTNQLVKLTMLWTTGPRVPSEDWQECGDVQDGPTLFWTCISEGSNPAIYGIPASDCMVLLSKVFLYCPFMVLIGGGWVVRRCRVSYVTGASNWYWLTVGQGLLSL